MVEISIRLFIRFYLGNRYKLGGYINNYVVCRNIMYTIVSKLGSWYIKVVLILNNLVGRVIKGGKQLEIQRYLFYKEKILGAANKVV